MKARLLGGVALIGIGLFLLMFYQGSTFSTGDLFAYLWPTLFILPISLLLHWLHFGMLGGRAPGLLIPGGILLVVSIVCQISTLFHAWSYWWPGFIAAIGFGLLEFYWLGDRNKWLKIPIAILFSISAVFFAVFSLGRLILSSSLGIWLVAIAMIGGGALLLLTSALGRSRKRFW